MHLKAFQRLLVRSGRSSAGPSADSICGIWHQRGRVPGAVLLPILRAPVFHNVKCVLKFSFECPLVAAETFPAEKFKKLLLIRGGGCLCVSHKQVNYLLPSRGQFGHIQVDKHGFCGEIFTQRFPRCRSPGRGSCCLPQILPPGRACRCRGRCSAQSSSGLGWHKENGTSLRAKTL